MLVLFPENTLRWPKLRNPNRGVSASPPVIAPLVFVQDPPFDLAIDEILTPLTLSTSLHQISSTHRSASIKRPESQKLDRPSLPIFRQQSSCSAEVAAPSIPTPALTENPNTAMTDHESPNTAIPNGSLHFKSPPSPSDVGHGLRSSVSLGRSTIIRRLNMRSSKPSLSASTPGLPTPTDRTPPATSSAGRWSKWRRAVSEFGRSSRADQQPSSTLPFVKVMSPPSVHLSTDPSKKDRLSSIIQSPVDALPDNIDSLQLVHDNRIPRPKFTLPVDDLDGDFSRPPSPGLISAPMKPARRRRSAPPLRIQSLYDRNLLSRSVPLPERRWSFATAVTDEAITDEVLVQELERLRLHNETSGSADDMGGIWDPDYILFGLFGSQELPESWLKEGSVPAQPTESKCSPPLSARDLPYTPSLPSFLPPHSRVLDTVSKHHWQTARRVLLTCRELVQTERHYLTSLRTLLAIETHVYPPPLMLKCAEELASVSEMFLAQLQGNASSWGVAAAFVSVEEAIESAFVGWCGVVGTWFDDVKYESTKDDSSRRSMAPTRRFSKIAIKFNSNHELNAEEVTLKSMKSWRRKSWFTLQDLKPNSAPPSLSASANGRGAHGAKRPFIRDLAILPTQRIVRYVLLYRDLLSHTPSTSPCRGLLKRAADAALSIAQKCDRAQANAAFIAPVDRKQTHPS